MIGKLIVGIIVGTLRLISYIPFIGYPLARTIGFVLENLLRLIANLIKSLPYILGIAFFILLVVYWR
jgi:hypothetical protein